MHWNFLPGIRKHFSDPNFRVDPTDLTRKLSVNTKNKKGKYFIDSLYIPTILWSKDQKLGIHGCFEPLNRNLIPSLFVAIVG